MSLRRSIVSCLALILLGPWAAVAQTAASGAQSGAQTSSSGSAQSTPKGDSTQKKKKRVWTDEDMADLRSDAPALPAGFSKRTWELQDMPPQYMPVKRVTIALPDELQENTVLRSWVGRVYQDDDVRMVVIVDILNHPPHPEGTDALDGAEEDYFARNSGTKPASTQTDETTLNGLPGRILTFDTQGAEKYTNFASLTRTDGWPISVTCKVSQRDGPKLKDRCMAIIRSVSAE